MTKLFKEIVPEDNHGNPFSWSSSFFYPAPYFKGLRRRNSPIRRESLRRSGPEVSEARPDRYPLRGGWEKKVIGIKQKAEKENAEH